MNRFFLPLLVCMAFTAISFQSLVAQNYNETESNNSFATANTLLRYPDTLNAVVNGADGIDYFKLDLNYFYTTLGYRTGTLVFNIIATNNGANGSLLQAQVYNGLQGAGSIHTENIDNLNTGVSTNRTIRVCGVDMDDYYLSLSTSGDFTYRVYWFFSDPNQNTEPNNTRATAASFPHIIGNQYRQSIEYRYRQDPFTDTVDYFKTILTAPDYSNIFLEILAKNNSCIAGQNVSYAVYRNNELTPFATGLVGNNASVPQFTETFTSVPLAGMVQGDSLFVKTWATAAFGTRFTLTQQTIVFDHEFSDFDPEGFDIISWGENQQQTAQVGYHMYEDDEFLYNEFDDPLTDDYDTYEFTLPQDGVMSITVTARNDECASTLYYTILDEFGSSLPNLDYQELMTWTGNCNETKSAVIKIRAIMAGTYRFAVHTDNSGTPNRTSYSIRYSLAAYTSGSTDPEPNNTQPTALLINSEETKNGYVNFINPDNNIDDNDMYRTVTQEEGSIRVYVKATYRGADITNNTSNAFTFNCTNNSFIRRIPATALVTNLISDNTYLDTFVVAGVPAGNVYFNLSSNQAWDYEFRFEPVDSIDWENDIEPNNSFVQAQPVAEGDTTYGRMGYTVNSVTDNSDYFRAVLPASGKIRVIIEATNSDETPQPGFDELDFWVYDGQANGSNFYHEFVDLNDNAPPGTILYDTVDICGIAADTIYFRFISFQKFLYKFSFHFSDPVTDNAEPNGNFAQAKKIRGNHTEQGTVGYTYREVNDQNDFYKVVFGSNDTLRLFLSATNRGCGNAGARVTLFKKNQSQVLTRFIGGSSNVAPGVTVLDTVKWGVTAVDTIYIRIQSSNAYEYELTTGPLVPNSIYHLTGDQAVCLGQTVYTAHNITEDDVTYNWSLPSGGGTISFIDSIATVTWTQTSTRIVRLVLSNSAGNSDPRQLDVVVNSTPPTQVPVAFNFARTLSTNTLPPGATVQWYRNDVLIPGAIDSSYYASLAGSYTVKFVNDCGGGPSSNAINFDADVQTQTISFPHTTDFQLTPNTKLKLNATSSSGLPVFFQLVSGNGASIINDTLYITKVGPHIVRALQPGDNDFNAATPVLDSITVLKGDQVITFDSIPDKIYTIGGSFEMFASTTSAGTVSFSVVSGHGTTNGRFFNFKGAGTVTVRAFHNGSSNYNAAVPVERTFCIGVRTLNQVAGDPNPCIATYKYTTNKIPGANFVWTLSGGGILTTNNDTAFVQWQTPGSYTLTVKANSGCDVIFSEIQQLEINTSNNAPTAVSGMLPANNATDQQLPLTLSWIPGPNTVSYDLYVWDSAGTQPLTPYVANLEDISFKLPKNSFAYNTSYKWRVVAKNPCFETPGPIQQFRIIPLPDLIVSEVFAPVVANSGQTISISWTIKNNGPGRTPPNEVWHDGVWFSRDSIQPFAIPPLTDYYNWHALTNLDNIPLLIGKKPRLTALDSGQSYTNSIEFTLPDNASFPVYVIVVTDDGHPNYTLLQTTQENDTGRAAQQLNIQLSPRPDLRIDTVVAPSAIFSGSPVNLTYQVKNYGALTPAGENWVDSVFISQNPLFDRNQAIPLNLPKLDASYYPNAKKAFVSNSTQLENEESVTRSLEVVIPNYIFGTWFIYVHSNANGGLYEGFSAGNNINRAQVEVYLTPTPQLTINSLALPVTTASTTQPFGVNWSIKNEGFRDNIEKNRGHYINMGLCQINCNSGPNTVCYAPFVARDSVVFGSSYWVDRVYLSTEPNFLNTATAILVKEVNHGIKNSGIYPDIIPCPANVNGNVNVHNIVNPGANFPTTTNFNLPSNLSQGNYYVYVHTNATKEVFEYPGTPQIKRSDVPITVLRPDLTVPSLVVPSAGIAFQPIDIQYTVQNSGPGSVFNHERNDRIYVSIWPVFDANAQLVGTNTFTEDIGAGGSVVHSYEHTFEPASTGTYYFYVMTNYDSLFRENSMSNNVSAAGSISITAATPADLVVTSVAPVDSFFTIFLSKLEYTVTNNGPGRTAGTWTDSIFISCSPVFTPATSYLIGTAIHSDTINTGESYNDTVFMNTKYTYAINNCFAPTMYPNVYFYIKTNADTGAYEGSQVNNNVGGSGSTPITNPLVDHTVSNVSAPDNGTVGRPFNVGWTTKNIGYNPKLNHYYYYNEQVYFSPDSLLTANAVKSNSYLVYSLINRGDSLNFYKAVTVPLLETGDYYVLVKTNSLHNIPAEKETSNNVNLLRDAAGAAKKVHIVQPLLPDLVDTILVAPTSVAQGQPFTFIHRITNKGTGPTYPANWQGVLRLSNDFIIDIHADRILKNPRYNKVLNAGESMLDTITAVIPMSTPAGNYILISNPNSNDAIVESNPHNNPAYSLMSVYVPAATDLVPFNVTAPDTVVLGYTIDTVRWKTINNSAVIAKGHTKDGIYLAPGLALDSTSVLLGILNKNIEILPIETDSSKLAPLVTGVVEGNYNLIVRSDLQNYILESDKDNNLASRPVYVKVNELPMNSTVNNTLFKVSRYYKLNIHDSLLGATIRVTLKSNDSLTSINEMYVGGGYVPSGAHHDYKFDIPNYGNQQIVISEVNQQVYYITVTCMHPDTASQNITLKAEKLPFAILNVQSPSGGNSGNVTVKLSGSLFTPGMTSRLTNGTTTINASGVYFTNSTLVYATFSLQGKPLGLYDIILSKGDTALAIREDGFSIVPPNNGGLITGSGPNTGAGNGNEPGCYPGAPSGLNSQLVVEMVLPWYVLLERPILIQIHYHNPTNNDIPAQVRTLFSEEGLKMALTKEGVATGTTSLYLELVESGGPPGIIRAGGSGTILIHSRAPKNMPSDPRVLFKLK